MDGKHRPATWRTRSCRKIIEKCDSNGKERDGIDPYISAGADGARAERRKDHWEEHTIRKQSGDGISRPRSGNRFGTLYAPRCTGAPNWGVAIFATTVVRTTLSTTSWTTGPLRLPHNHRHHRPTSIIWARSSIMAGDRRVQAFRPASMFGSSNGTAQCSCKVIVLGDRQARFHASDSRSAITRLREK